MKISTGRAVRFTGILVALLLIVFTAAACTSAGKQAQVAQEGVQGVGPPAPEQKLNLAVYYFKMTEKDDYLIREVHQVPYTKEVEKAALEELINSNPVTAGAARVLPQATKIRGVVVKDGLATVDFSREVLRANVGASGEEMGIQSIVNTLTEIAGITKVSFTVEGKVDREVLDWWGHVGLYTQPFQRDVSKVYEPAIWVTAPEPGQKVGFPMEVRGSARVFEATVNARLTDESGKALAKGYGTASEGAPGRGSFVFSLPVNATSPGRGKLEVFWVSPKDGLDKDKVTVPVTWD